MLIFFFPGLSERYLKCVFVCLKSEKKTFLSFNPLVHFSANFFLGVKKNPTHTRFLQNIFPAVFIEFSSKIAHNWIQQTFSSYPNILRCIRMRCCQSKISSKLNTFPTFFFIEFVPVDEEHLPSITFPHTPEIFGKK